MLMIVDDDPRFLAQAQEMLTGDGPVYFAGNAEHAYQLMAVVGAGFSVVMIDLDLPGKDGFALIREMRQHFPDLPIIAISGVFQTHVLESAKALGATDTLQKPVTAEWKAVIQRARTAS
jgi:CheY-like chemotaxis protein